MKYGAGGFGKIDILVLLLVVLVVAVAVQLFASAQQLDSVNGVLKLAAPSLCLAFFGFTYHVRNKIVELFDIHGLSKDERRRICFKLERGRVNLHWAMCLYIATAIFSVVSQFPFLSSYPEIEIYVRRLSVILFSLCFAMAFFTLKIMKEVEDFKVSISRRVIERERIKQELDGMKDDS